MPNYSSYSARKKRQNIMSRLFGGLIILVLFSFLGTALYLVGQSSETRRRATESDAVVPVTLQATQVGSNQVRVFVMINTWGYSLAGFDVRGEILGASPSQVAVENSTQLSMDTVASTLTSVTNGTGFRLVKFAPLSPTAVTSTGGQTRVLFSFLVTNPSNNRVTVALDSNQSLFSFQVVGDVDVSYVSAQTFTLQQTTQQPTASPTNTTHGGFFIRKYNDLSGNGVQDKGEPGLSWKFQWDSNGDSNWHDYDTFANKLGEGGVVTLPVGTQVRIREIARGGWNPTTPTEVTIRIRAGENQLMVFGNTQPKASPAPTSRPRTATPRPTAIATVVPTPMPTSIPTATPDQNVRIDLLPSPAATVAPSPTPASTQSGSILLPFILIGIAVIIGIAILAYLLSR